MGLFSKLSREELKSIEKEEKFEKKLRSLTLFPGDLAEYERFVGYECEIIDTGLPEKFIKWESWQTRTGGPPGDYSPELKERLLKKGLEALIHYSVSIKFGPQYLYMGVPIKRK